MVQCLHCQHNNGVKKIVELTKKFKFVNSYSMKKRGKTFETHLDDFLSDIDMLFNIFCHDREQRRIQEEEHKLRMILI